MKPEFSRSFLSTDKPIKVWHMVFFYLSNRRPATAQASQYIRTVSRKPSLLLGIQRMEVDKCPEQELCLYTNCISFAFSSWVSRTRQQSILSLVGPFKVRKVARIRNRYNQVPHLS